MCSVCNLRAIRTQLWKAIDSSLQYIGELLSWAPGPMAAGVAGVDHLAPDEINTHRTGTAWAARGDVGLPQRQGATRTEWHSGEKDQHSADQAYHHWRSSEDLDALARAKKGKEQTTAKCAKDNKRQAGQSVENRRQTGPGFPSEGNEREGGDGEEKRNLPLLAERIEPAKIRTIRLVKDGYVLADRIGLLRIGRCRLNTV